MRAALILKGPFPVLAFQHALILSMLHFVFFKQVQILQ